MTSVVWGVARPAAEQQAVASALAQPGLIETTLQCLFGEAGIFPGSASLRVRHLATGGAKRVYLIMAHLHDGGSYPFVLKQFLPIRLAHLPPGATVAGAPADAADLDDRQLERMVWAIHRVDELAPGLCPRLGGFWAWSEATGLRHRAMTEAYVEGHSLERWKSLIEDRFIKGDIDFAHSCAQRQALERLGIAAYVRLWAVLGCSTFTSDPSPWNVLFTQTRDGFRPSIIDLHSIHDGGTPLYVFQTLEEQFGSRDEVREQVLCPGILDALGRTAGVEFLESVRLGLEAQSEVRDRAGLSQFTSGIRAISRFLTALSEWSPDMPPTDRPS